MCHLMGQSGNEFTCNICWKITAYIAGKFYFPAAPFLSDSEIFSGMAFSRFAQYMESFWVPGCAAIPCSQPACSL